MHLIADNLIEVSTSELKFSFEQTKVYFSRFGDIQLNEEQICKLYELTDGWPAALKLSTFLIKQPPNVPLKNELLRISAMILSIFFPLTV